MKIGVIGAGTMGSGIAQTFAQAEGFTVVLCDMKQEWADKGKEKIKKNLMKRVQKGKMTEAEAQKHLSAITTGVKEELCADCDMVVEAVYEDMELKKTILNELDKICRYDCILVSNTSSLSITEMGKGLNHPFVGMHFFNPAPAMKLIEVIAGYNSCLADTTMTKVVNIAKQIGKTPVQVNEAPGFVVNRILMPEINEGIGIFADRVASIRDIDEAMKLGANHPMGPLELGDYIGLDVVLAIMEVLYNEYQDTKYRPHTLLKKMVRAGRLGVKSGIGFYTYNTDGTKTPIDEQPAQ